MSRKKIGTPLFFFLFFLLLPLFANTESPSQQGFHPTWKLLSSQEKQHFIAGYLQGWRDAAKVTDIAIDYVRTNPSQAVDGLERIKKLYNISGLKPTTLAQEIDAFYSDPENQTAPLSAAITAAKNRVP